MKSMFALKWTKELVGAPTYLSIIVISMTLLGGGIFATLVCVLVIAYLYNFLYEKIFPNYEINGKTLSLLFLFLAQLLVWGISFYFLSYFYNAT